MLRMSGGSIFGAYIYDLTFFGCFIDITVKS